MKLDEIHKLNFFKVPGDYFDTLPGRIQERIRETEVRPVIIQPVISFKYLVPAAAFALALLVVVLVITEKKPTPVEMLSQVPTESLVSYLVASEISTEEFFENIDLSIIANDFFTEQDMEIDSLGVSIDEIERLLLDEFDIHGEYL
ncbi:MAG TPA: hypothetical protein VI583_07480 [Cyclobacteriaceae bacterium]|nr:hypothetical protein [Cyclobacteriaceae bacterium]